MYYLYLLGKYLRHNSKGNIIFLQKTNELFIKDECDVDFRPSSGTPIFRLSST